MIIEANEHNMSHIPLVKMESSRDEIICRDRFMTGEILLQRNYFFGFTLSIHR